MSDLTEQRLTHGLASAAIVLMGVAFAGSLVLSAVGLLMKKANTLAALVERADELETRLSHQRKDTVNALAMLSATPGDFGTISVEGASAALIKSICDRLQGGVGATCTPSEVPITGSMALYRAAIAASGEPSALLAALLREARTPLRVTALTLKSIDGGKSVQMEALVEIVGRRSPESET